MGDDVDRSNWSEQDYQAERVGQQLTEIATGHPAPPPSAPPAPEPPPSPGWRLWQSLRAGLTGWRLQALLVVFLLALLVIIWNLITTYVELSRPGPFDAAAGPVGQVDAEAGAPAAAEGDATEGAGVQPGDPVETGEPGAGEEIQEQPGEPGQDIPGAEDPIRAAAGTYRVSESSVALALAPKIDHLESATGSITIGADGRVGGRFVFVYWGMFEGISDDGSPARSVAEYTLESSDGLTTAVEGLEFTGTVTANITIEVADLDAPVSGTVSWPVVGRTIPGSGLLELTVSDDAGFEFAVEFLR